MDTSQIGQAIRSIAAGGFNRLARGKWLDLLSENFYQNFRKPAVTTEGVVRLVDAGGVGPVSKEAGEL